ncbi:MAG: DUF4249 domain-containing protein [Tenuifilaceae bacterium]|jgi:hypothetical protein|nr:DUF4249 domain-containing protein [Tenuifilaceae bacterium]
MLIFSKIVGRVIERIEVRPLMSIIFLLGMFSCIDPYYPHDTAGGKNVYVIEGTVTNESSRQIIRVSLASRIDKPQYTPVQNCAVSIIDGQGNVFGNINSGTTGEYYIDIPEQYLIPEAVFRLHVTTPSGYVFESETDTLKSSPPVDVLYYSISSGYNSELREEIPGVQFKVDLKKLPTDSYFYRWKLTETYEYRSRYPIEYISDGVSTQRIYPPDYSLFYCWKTSEIRNLFLLSTKSLLGDEIKGFNLHFVDNRNVKLRYVYSLLVKQLAYTEASYGYLQAIKDNNSSLGGLFDGQPVLVRGNISCTSDPSITTLGNFSVAAVTTSRFTFDKIEEDLPLSIIEGCIPRRLDRGFEEFSPSDFPVFFVKVGGALLYADKQCFDCTLLGGTNEKPTFLP